MLNRPLLISPLTRMAATQVCGVSADAARLAAAKVAYSVRRVDRAQMCGLQTDAVSICSGDVVLARVQQVGQHSALQLTNGRRATLFCGDEVLVAYGNRYAPDQFEALVPEDLDACDLVAGGGIAARTVTQHRKMRAATRILPLGLVADGEGRVLNLKRFGLPALNGTSRSLEGIPMIGVVGTSMNAGKTTTASYLIRGLHSAGLRVGASKLTGTGSSGDTDLMLDAGAERVLDFTDAGLATTYLAGTREVIRAADLVLEHLAATGVQAIVVEIADGLFQRETAALLTSDWARQRFSGLIFAAADAMGAAAGVDWLEQRGLPVLAVAGALTMSPLAAREAREQTHLPVLGLDALADATQATSLLDAARSGVWAASRKACGATESARV